jgi:hypothetical protein
LLEPMKDQPLSWYTTTGEKAGQIQTGTAAKEPRGYSPFVDQAIQACADMTDPPISSKHSLRALRTVYAIYDAAKSGHSEKVD